MVDFIKENKKKTVGALAGSGAMLAFLYQLYTGLDARVRETEISQARSSESILFIKDRLTSIDNKLTIIIGGRRGQKN